MKKTLGMMIAELRKEHGMTQIQLAEKMGVTDKAVSKWERALSCPDINALPHLAGLFNICVDELMQLKKDASAPRKRRKELIDLIFKAVALAMGIAVVVLSVLNKLAAESGIVLLGIGMTCIGISSFHKNE